MSTTLRQRRFAPALFLATLLLGGETGRAATEEQGAAYPGPKPGPSHIRSDAPEITLGNAALEMRWRVTPDGLKARSLTAKQSGQTLVLTGEVFQIVLGEGTRYPASRLAPEGPPRVSAWSPDPTAARRAAGQPGQEMRLPLRSADGRLRVIWRAMVHDGANYCRQEVEVRPSGQDCLLREIVWFETALPGARPAGRVDGSPVVAGDCFLACEDPHALNRVNVSSQPVGTWEPEDLTLGQPRRKTWLLDPAQLQPGTNEFEFRYGRGPHRLDIWRAALLEDGREVARDEHHGRTGTEDVENSYGLALAQAKPGARYELAADLGTDPNLKLRAGERVMSFGEVRGLRRDGPASFRLRRAAPLRQGESLTISFVAGVAPPGQMRRAFLAYLETERAHPYRPFLHYNSWYDTAWAPFALNETNCLEAIRLCGERLIQPHGVVMDALVFDDGWDNPKSLWQFHGGFPNGFAPLADLCRRYQTRLGVWLSPFGGYGEPKNQRLKFGAAQGYETNATGFSLAGPKYYAAFKGACVNMIRRYGVNHFKFDGIASGMYADGPGAAYVLDTEAMRRLMLELRREDPAVYINLTTGSWPSPFWLRYADSVWRQGGDMGLAGPGPRQQQWLTYRDQEVYRNIVRKGPLFPLNSLMTQGVAYSRQGSAGDPSFNSAGFKDDVRAFFGAGTGLQELYIQPAKLTAADWQVLAEAARWSRANAPVLVDTHWVGGDPGRLEVYGYASWTPRRAALMLRNPDAQPREFSLDVGSAFELPPGAPLAYTLKSPWAEDAAQPALAARAGTPIRLTLKPFQVLVWDAWPAP